MYNPIFSYNSCVPEPPDDGNRDEYRNWIRAFPVKESEGFINCYLRADLEIDNPVVLKPGEYCLVKTAVSLAPIRYGYLAIMTCGAINEKGEVLIKPYSAIVEDFNKVLTVPMTNVSSGDIVIHRGDFIATLQFIPPMGNTSDGNYTFRNLSQVY